MDETSFLPSVRGVWAAGTVGWLAPEILRGEVEVEVRVDEATAAESSERRVGGWNLGDGEPFFSCFPP